VLDNAIKDLPPRWRNWIVRGISSFILIFAFGLIIYMGPLPLVFLILVIQGGFQDQADLE
jgi:phosphatidate cytidylyltransferase